MTAIVLAALLAGCDMPTMSMSSDRKPRVASDQAYIDARTVLLQAVTDPTR